MPLELYGNRFLTLNSVIRVNQIEVARDRCEGVDEYDQHSPENIIALRDAVAKAWPGGRMTWSLSWQALYDDRPHYVEARRLVRDYHNTYGDDVTFIPGGYFSNVYNTREQINRDLHEGIHRISEIMGAGYRPGSVQAGFLAADNLRFLAENENIHVCQGNIFSQYAIDNQDGDGSLCYPYYPSKEHFCKPAQGRNDFIDCVNLDGWTVDFLAARLPGDNGSNSRLGVGPLETLYSHGSENGLKQMMFSTANHFDTGFALNGFAWVTVCWEASIVPAFCQSEDLASWLQQVRAKWPTSRLVTQAELGHAWRSHYKNNDDIDYRFVQRGSGLEASDPNLEIRWFMNKAFRLALLSDVNRVDPPNVIDFTRYDIPAQEPQSLLTRNWNLLGQINQKQTRPQDKPVPLSALSIQDQERIYTRYPMLRDNKPKPAVLRRTTPLKTAL
ncbi:MAG: DUF3863 domain-containing protein [Sedimentisphaerales bacterium]|nr:DUF3863 domain-containing protein [Sedimentisphaerales bacterium]